MLLRRHLTLHVFLGGAAFALILIGAVSHGIESRGAGRWVGGGSIVGLATGILAACIIGFELLLWPRKKMRRKKLGPTRWWLAAHLWFGLASGPLAFIHAGYRLGGTFTSILMLLLAFVLVSGIYGWVMQIVIPRWLLGNLPAETITSQIDDVSIQNALDARRMLTVAYGPKPEGLTKLTSLESYAAAFQGDRTVVAKGLDKSGFERIVVGAVQRRMLPNTRTAVASSADVDPGDARLVWKEYASVIDPFLLNKIPGLAIPAKQWDVAKLETKQRSIAYFSLLRQSCSEGSQAILNRLESLCDQRHQFNTQKRAQFWLHGWIVVHASASVLLGVLLFAHIILALRYL